MSPSRGYLHLLPPDTNRATAIKCAYECKASPPDPKPGKFGKERLMGHCIIGLLEVNKYYICWFSNNLLTLYNFNNTGYLGHTFFTLAKAGLSPAKQPTFFCCPIDPCTEDHAYHLQNGGHQQDSAMAGCIVLSPGPMDNCQGRQQGSVWSNDRLDARHTAPLVPTRCCQCPMPVVAWLLSHINMGLLNGLVPCPASCNVDNLPCLYLSSLVSCCNLCHRLLATLQFRLP
jgi:hypothetical protein